MSKLRKEMKERRREEVARRKGGKVGSKKK